MDIVDRLHALAIRATDSFAKAAMVQAVGSFGKTGEHSPATADEKSVVPLIPQYPIAPHIRKNVRMRAELAGLDAKVPRAYQAYLQHAQTCPEVYDVIARKGIYFTHFGKGAVLPVSHFALAVIEELGDIVSYNLHNRDMFAFIDMSARLFKGGVQGTSKELVSTGKYHLFRKFKGYCQRHGFATLDAQGHAEELVPTRHGHKVMTTLLEDYVLPVRKIVEQYVATMPLSCTVPQAHSRTCGSNYAPRCQR
jgi:hypothetical protein